MKKVSIEIQSNAEHYPRNYAQERDSIREVENIYCNTANCNILYCLEWEKIKMDKTVNIT